MRVHEASFEISSFLAFLWFRGDRYRSNRAPKQALSILWRLHKGICHIFNSKFLNLFAPCLQMPLNLVIGHKILSLRLLLEAHFVSRKWRDVSEGGDERQGTFRAVDHFNNKLIINSQKTKSLTICCRVFVTLADFLL